MSKSRFYRHNNFKKVNKTRALVLFEQGIQIFILPNKLNIYSTHDLTSRIHKEDSGDNFDDIVKANTASQCINGCGTYLSYFYDERDFIHDGR